MHKITPALCLVLLANAASAAESTAAVAPAATAPGAATYATVPRLEFNRQAVVRNLPLFWVRDADADGTLDPEELAVTWGPGEARLDRYVKDGGFTPEFAAAYALIAQPVSLEGLAAAEKTRRQAVLEELAQGRPTLVRTTLTDPRDVRLVGHVENAARIIERLFAKQRGVYGLASRIPDGDTASSALFFRNQRPFCEAPKTENDPNCSALAPRPQNISGMYPAAIQADAGFCTVLEKRADADALFNPFSIVSNKAGGRAKGDPATDELVAVPYHVSVRGRHEGGQQRVAGRRRTAGRGSVRGCVQGIPGGRRAGVPRRQLVQGRRRLEGDDGDELQVVPARRPGRGLRGSLFAQGEFRGDVRAHQPGVARLAATPRAGQGRHGGGAGERSPARHTRRARSDSPCRISSTSC